VITDVEGHLILHFQHKRKSVLSQKGNNTGEVALSVLMTVQSVGHTVNHSLLFR